MAPLWKFALALGLAGSIAQAAHAGPVSDFETAMREAYGDYRVALFATNAGDAQKAAAAVEGFRAMWEELARDNTQPPPQYADDPAYSQTLSEVSAIIGKAAQQVGEAELSEAHETLEAIREEIAGLHERNGIIGFSDRMNAYHAKMEEVLGQDYSTFDTAAFGMLREDAAVLAYLAEQVAAHPPVEASDPAFPPLLEALEKSVAALMNAARNADASAAKKALSGLKPPYAKLFLKFG